MKVLKLSQILAAASVIGLMASQASAGFCLTQIRNFPTSALVNDQMNISCQNEFDGVTAGQAIATNTGGNKTVRADKTAGGAGLKVTSQGIDSSGNILCASEDASIGGAAVVVACSSAVTRFRGVVEYIE